MAYLVLFGLELFATGGHLFSAMTSSGVANVVATYHEILMSPAFAGSANLFTAAWAVVVDVALYLTIFVQILFLWMPTVFSDPNMLWLWWYVCLPVDLGMVLSIVFIVRGVHSA